MAAIHTAGFVKILAEPRYGEIVGAHVVGAGATELIAELTPLVPADIGTGSSTTRVENISTVYTGIDQTRPCPTCESGSCNGGDRNGMSCTIDATHPAFGDMSYDCPPSAGANITGAGLSIVLDLSEGESADQGVCPATPFTTLSFVRAGCVPPQPEELRSWPDAGPRTHPAAPR